MTLVTIDSTECVVTRLLHCTRGPGHDPWNAPVQERWWTCAARGEEPRVDEVGIETWLAMAFDGIMAKARKR